MPKIKLSDSTFTVCPEGEHLFLITKVEQDSKNPALIVLTFKTPDGYTDVENYRLMNDDGTKNEGALGAFSRVAKCAFRDQGLEEVEPKGLVGKPIKATVEHTQKESRTTGKMLTFTSLTNIESVTVEEWNAAYTAAKSKTAAPTPAPAAKPKFDLNAIFGK